jgi:hypothetical protein
LRGRTINRRITAFRIRYHGHILRRSTRGLLHRAMRYTVWKRRRGRPVITWKDSLTSDRQQYDYSSAEWEEAASDKLLIKRMTEELFDPDLPEEFDSIVEDAISDIDDIIEI